MKRYWLLLLGVIVFGVIIGYRAAAIPFTHDEAGTWLNYGELNVWTCLTNPYCWGSANNHWLNTALLQFTSWIGGDSPFAIRLPNVLAGIGYLICAALICYRYIKDPIPALAGFMLLVGHVYVLDFFSLARGYGLMVSGVIWGIYGLLRYAERYELRWLLWTVFALILSILANFTALLPWATIGVSWFVWLMLQKQYSLLIRHGFVWLISGVALFALLRYPIQALSGAGEFEWGAAGPGEMVQNLISNLIYGFQYFDHHTSSFLFWGVLAVLAVILVGTVFVKKSKQQAQLYLSFILLFFSFIVILLYQEITGSNTPIGRKSIYLVPFIFLPVALGLSLIIHKLPGIFVGVVICYGIMLHIGNVIQWSACREWYYDAYYPELFSTILPESKTSGNIKLGASWIFIPALSYYQQTRSIPISCTAHQNPIVIDTTLQYYYVETSDTTGMYANGFVLEKHIGPFVLFKRTAATDTSQEMNTE